MSPVVLIIFYGSILFSIIASIFVIKKFSSLPPHLRWEYYLKGSVYENIEWWNRPYTGLWEKIRLILIDIFSLRAFYKRNRNLWIFLYTFHTGIYLLILWHVWLFIASFFINHETSTITGLVWGHISTGLAFIGGLGILYKRISDEELRIFYSPLHYIKWVLLLITLLSGFYAVQFYFDASMPALFKYVETQVTFKDMEHKLHPPPATAAHVLFGSIWLIYLPFSHILRLFLRYYHYLRYDELPNIKDEDLEKKIRNLLEQKISWSAPHIQSGKSWLENAIEPINNKKAPK